MTALGYGSLFVGLLCFTVWSHLELYQRGYAKGREDGKKDAHRYWVEIEQQVGIEREKIWREES
jgi:hypothetical protein